MKKITASWGGRKCDPHLRMVGFGDAAAPSGQNTAAMLLARGDIDAQAAHRWLHAEMNCVRASGLLQFTHPHICCHIGNAARVGKPAADLFFSTVVCGVAHELRGSPSGQTNSICFCFVYITITLTATLTSQSIPAIFHKFPPFPPLFTKYVFLPRIFAVIFFGLTRHFATPAGYCPVILRIVVGLLQFWCSLASLFKSTLWVL